MNRIRNSGPALLAVLLMILACLPVLGFAESADIQRITVPNAPIKGVISLEKHGPILKGFNESRDAFGHTIHTPIYDTGWLEGAVFEVRAVEDIVGKDGTLWFRAGELADTIITTAEINASSRQLPLGHYWVTEVSAPAGYRFAQTRYDVVLEAVDHETPVVTVQVTADNDYLPARISLVKEKEILSTVAGEDGTVHTALTYAPGEGFVFGLCNAEPIAYPGGTLAADSLIATAVSDPEGRVTFLGKLPVGQYYVKELLGPSGWVLNPERIPISLTKDTPVDGDVLSVHVEKPVRNRLNRTDVRISKTDLTGAEYLPHCMIEVRNARGETILKDYTGEDGYLPAFPAIPGEYTYREVLAPEGYELCTTELRFAVTESGEVEGKTAVADDYARFSILKVDADHKPLAGVTFGLFREDGTLQASAVTDSDGLAVFEQIPYGTYTVQETKALPGYLMNKTKVTVTIDGTFVNPSEPVAVLENCESEILLRKVDQDGSALPGAVFGLFDADGTQVMRAVSDAEGLVRFTGVNYGSYTIRELSAPAGYLMSRETISITLDEGYTNSDEPAATVMNPLKRIMLIKVNPAGTPIPGVSFGLYSAETMELAETAVSDENGVILFHNFDYGDWIIREEEAPEGFSRMEDIRIHVNDGWTEPQPVMCVNIPNHYEFIKTNSDGAPLAGIKFRLEDEAGNELGIYESGEDGIVRITDLQPGTYLIREIETLEGYTLSGEVVKVVLDEYYVIPEQMKRVINYTHIQTGVQIAVTGIMWAGLALMVISGTVGIIRKRRQRKAK